MTIKIERALISVYDKSNILQIVKLLAQYRVQIISTGQTAEYIRQNNFEVTDIASYTGFPEILGGRVKTLNPKIFGGILADSSNNAHKKDLKDNNINAIELVIVNLYPFLEVTRVPGHSKEQAIENIDIGGVSLIRAAAKNHQNCVCITDPSDYESFVKEFEKSHGRINPATSALFAIKAFRKTFEYDQAIYHYFSRDDKEEFPSSKIIHVTKKEDLRYGENPHQKAAVYRYDSNNVPGVVNSRFVHGKRLSYNNIIDLEAALAVVKDIEKPSCAIIKHTNPCGAAVSDSPVNAFTKALDSDKKSAFGGIVAFNQKVDAITAKKITEKGNFFEAVIAPYFEAMAIDILKTSSSWSENLRLLECGALNKITQQEQLHIRTIEGGLLLQTPDSKELEKFEVIGSPLTPEEERDLLFAWHIVKHMMSNAICIVKDETTVGLCGGQTNRIDAVSFAIQRASKKLSGACLASDGFFPFDDSVKTAALQGIKCIIQPGGSKNDKEVIKAAKDNNIKMVMTGIRHFRH